MEKEKLFPWRLHIEDGILVARTWVFVQVSYCRYWNKVRAQMWSSGFPRNRWGMERKRNLQLVSGSLSTWWERYFWGWRRGWGAGCHVFTQLRSSCSNYLMPFVHCSEAGDELAANGQPFVFHSPRANNCNRAAAPSILMSHRKSLLNQKGKKKKAHLGSQ